MIEDKRANLLDELPQNSPIESHDHSDVLECLQNIVCQFESEQTDDDNFFLTPILMTNDLIQDYLNDKHAIAIIFETISKYYPLIFGQIEKSLIDKEICIQLLSLIQNITCFSDLGCYQIYLSSDFFLSLVEIFINNSKLDIRIGIISVISNTFEDVSIELQHFIIQKMSPFLIYWENKRLRRKIIKFIYIICCKYSNIDENMVTLLIRAFIQFHDQIWYSYYYSFFSLYHLIRQKKFPITLFIQSELLEIYNFGMDFKDHNNKVIESDFLLLWEIINQLPKGAKAIKMFDYKKSIQVMIENHTNYTIVNSILDFFISSATLGPNMQHFLLDLNLLPIMEEISKNAPFSTLQNLIHLYSNLVPRENLPMRLSFIKNSFFVELLKSIDSYKAPVQYVVLNLIYNTLKKCEIENNSCCKEFLIDFGMIDLLEMIETQNKKVMMLIDWIQKDLNE
ncbi:hypothetical protein TRFO_37523 [Tritrichomonas foetus]|uniref:Uncharacterized protein n=1 Tax=Tritrichomonas foetus TaxID=1144522 RepID=A0A1J4JF83_9EUKA|nr:hypothetical protein TRFO_37523 [Tritrichomonas foetus]|eukprot:OHS96307.1 hypothetical protein TRFO_37523 [Tritrichomonas foetus]